MCRFPFGRSARWRRAAAERLFALAEIARRLSLSLPLTSLGWGLSSLWVALTLLACAVLPRWGT